MTATAQSMQVRRPSESALSPAPQPIFSSNNPFRRRLPTPSSASQEKPKLEDINPIRSFSNNPFLDSYSPDNVTAPKSRRSPSPLKRLPNGDNVRTQRHPSNVVAQVNGLTLTEKPLSSTNVQPRPSIGLRPGSENRPGRDEKGRYLTDVGAASKLQDRDIFAGSPEKMSETRRPRRNSESSTIDIKDSERRRRSRRQDSAAKPKDDKPTRSSRSKRPNHQVDIIDKLDVTGIYGPGLFHHDGPFDACNPHRNRKGAKTAPMQAFPEGSANNAIGGSGPVNKGLNLDVIHGRGAEGFTDFNDTSAADTQAAYVRRPYLVNPYTENQKTGFEQVHGQESLGLGTTTFLEGAPAPPRLSGRRESEQTERTAAINFDGSSSLGSGLQRKKSVIQKLRGLSRSRPLLSAENREFGRYGDAISTSPGGADSPNGIYTTQSAGGRGRGLTYEKNPFFAEESIEEIAQVKAPGGDQGVKGRSSLALGRQNTSPPVAPSAALTRRLTNDAAAAAAALEANEAKSGMGGGLLQRVKSLRGGRRPRPEQRVS